MNRREFLGKLGIGAAFVLSSSCLQSCKKESNGSVDFTLNLDDPNYVKLKTNGNYIVVNQVVVAKGTDGNYYAATVICSHEQKKEVTYDKNKNEYYCTAHGARFDLSGNGLNNNGSKDLETYQTNLNGTELRVFS
ncbi:MAG: Rieske 2Fe-2S domain-containing protein [Chitinophagales bacterium]|nr:Rieske 2Fe-2S domain-containing protein [Chitinophagales bacterium]